MIAAGDKREYLVVCGRFVCVCSSLRPLSCARYGLAEPWNARRQRRQHSRASLITAQPLTVHRLPLTIARSRAFITASSAAISPITSPKVLHFPSRHRTHADPLPPAPPNSRTTARQKLTRLTIQQFHELSTDVYDELVRRKQNDQGVRASFTCINFVDSSLYRAFSSGQGRISSQA